MLAAQDVICAQVKIQIDQKATLTRTAFTATLVIDNATVGALEDLFVDIEIKDEDGNVVDAKFEGLSAPAFLENLTGVDGSSDVAPGTTATAKWVLIPTEDAAPTPLPERYTVGGKVSHLQQGILLDIPLYPVEIEVFPDAKLFLDYYLQTNVYSDNPFTESIEPAEPFSLGLRVQNVGFGDAKNLTITTSQPKIIENLKGLLIAFKIIAAQIGLGDISPCLTLPLGTVEAGSNRVARWLLESTLQGEFIDMDASFQHLNGLGKTSISLIKDVKIHPLVHVANLDIPGAPAGLLDPYQDDLPDFLVPRKDAPVPFDPQTGKPMFEFFHEAHLSGGSIVSIPHVVDTVLTAPPTMTNQVVGLQVQVLTPGWNYIRVQDQGGPSFELEQISKIGPGVPRVTIPVGSAGDVSNVWTSSRLISLCMTPALCDGPFGPGPYVLQELAHIVDWFPAPGTYYYSLVYDLERTDTLFADASIISVSAGGSQSLALDAGPANAGRTYVVLGSASGTGPWPVPGANVSIPLTPDAYFWFMLNTPSFFGTASNTIGVLDASGKANASINLAPGAWIGLNGLRLWHSFVLLSPVDFASNSVELVLTN
jgi:hypothetical protein